MRPYKTKALRKRASPQEAGQSGTITRSTEELYFILEGAGEIELDGEHRHGPPGRCDPHPARRVAHDRGYRAAALSLLLRAALLARGYVFHVTESEG